MAQRREQRWSRRNRGQKPSHLASHSLGPRLDFIVSEIRKGSLCAENRIKGWESRRSKETS